MRSSKGIVPATPAEQYVWWFDQRDLDNDNARAFTRLVYLDRVNRIVQTIRRHVPADGTVADVGCAQGNLALWLAEAGFAVDAYDLNEGFLAYATKKYEFGDIRWHHGNAFDISAPGQFDAVILGELVEHVAHPDELLARAVDLVKVGGAVVVTTPNGRNLRERLPSYQEVVANGGLPRIEAEQFGPGGEHHLFAYTIDELSGHVPANASLVSVDYVGTVLFNSHVQRILDRPVLGDVYASSARAVSRLPGLRDRVGLSLVLVLRRRR